MKTIKEFLAYLCHLDIKLWFENNALRYSAPEGTITTELQTQLRERKTEMLEFFKTNPSWNASTSELRQPLSRESHVVFPLSFAQQRLWFLAQLEGQSATYNIPATLHLSGKINETVLQRALTALVERHDSLRYCFPVVNGEATVQIIQVYNPLTVTDLTEFSETEQERLVTEWISKHAQTPFDLSTGPLLSMHLLKLSEQEQVLLCNMHHIMSDGWSLRVLIRDWSQLYSAYALHYEPKLPVLPIRYTDYTAWQKNSLQEQVLEQQLAYWSNKLAGVPELLKLPTDYPRPAVMRYQGKCLQSTLAQELLLRIKQLSQQNDVTIFMTLLAAFNVLLSRYSGQNDLVVGSPVANRTHRQTEDLIGFFVNPLVLRTQIQENKTFDELLKQVKQTALEAYAHQNIPFEYLLEQLNSSRSLSYSPLFQVMFILQEAPLEEFDLAGLKASFLEQETAIAKFDLTLSITEVNEVLLCDWEYNTDLFRPNTISLLAEHFRVLLEGIINNPKQVISQLPLLTETEKKQLMDWNQTQTEYPNEKTLVDLFQTQVSIYPENVALIFEEQQLTYLELNTRANQLAHYLMRLGVGVETLVGICVERSLEMVIGLLGILKAGGAYVPLDPNYPPQRLQFMLEDSQVPVLLTQSNLLERLPASTAMTVDLKTEWENITADSGENPVKKIGPDNLAYIIYTSGSTGKPTGVLGTHKGMVNRLTWMWHTSPFDAQEVCCHRTSINFVDHVAELFSPLLKGVSLVLLTEENTRDIVGMIDILSKYKVARIVLVPSLLRAILEQGDRLLQKLVSIKYWFCTGEALPAHLVKRFYEKIPEGHLWNIYGSSEVSADVMAYKVERQDILNILNYFSPERKFSNSFISLEEHLPQDTITTPFVTLEALKQAFKSQGVPLLPQKQEKYYAYLKKNILPYLVNTSSPRFIGHMTSALPSFNYELTDLVSRMNQNMVKVETSKSLVFMERQAMAMFHHAFYDFPESFYNQYVQQSGNSLGITVSGGTMANISALWIARNLALPSDKSFPGVAQAGLSAALKYYNYKNIVLLGSRLMHYSMRKAASLLGLGMENIIYVDQDKNGKMDIVALQRRIEECRQKQWCIFALIGIAGATETGNIDPLEEMAEIAKTCHIHFHVDGAWGAPVIFSEQHKGKLKGIERADSITICGHKQLYLPMGVSFCLFRQPDSVKAISTPAAYQAREGGYDFGQYSPEGSRSSLSMCLHAAFHLIGKQGYAKLIDEGIDKAQYLKDLINKNEAFELMREPELNIVNFRYIPTKFRKKQNNRLLTEEDNLRINEANIRLQERQFQEGRSFLSRTQLFTSYGKSLPIEVERAVLANPLTTYQDIDFVLEDQLTIAAKYIETGHQKNGKVQVDEQGISNVDKLSFSRLSTSFAEEELEEELLEKYTIPIGKPINNTQVYILDRYQKPAPFGVPGELHIGGVGLARGYFNRSNLTNEKFTEIELFGNRQRFYKTGDLARWLPNGNIEYLGRLDHQVKLRGFRIELGEIEAVLGQHTSVRESAVIFPEDLKAEQRLVAYFVPYQEQTIESTELYHFLTERLPDYMIPSVFIPLETMPLTPNGKVDRRTLFNLPVNNQLSEEAFVAPRTHKEVEIAKIWSKALGIEQIGVHDNFFKSGGHSLLGAQVISQVREIYQVELPLQILFEKPTVAGIAGYLEETLSMMRQNLMALPSENKGKRVEGEL